MDFLLVHTFTESLDKDRVMYYVWLSVFYWLQASAGKESTCNAGDLDSISGLGRYPGEGISYPFQCSVLENSMDCIVHGDSKSRTQLCDFQVCHSFSSKEQASFNFMAAVTICSDFGAQENKVCHCFHCFPIYLL